MSWITLQTTSGAEEYQISDLDEVVWWKTENAMIAVGYMDMVSGLMSLSDLEACRVKRPEIVHEFPEQQPSLKPKSITSNDLARPGLQPSTPLSPS